MVVGISLLETMVNLDYEPFEFAPVVTMWLVTLFMSDYVGGIIIGMYVHIILGVLRAVCTQDKDYIPAIPEWVLAAMMSLYYIL